MPVPNFFIVPVTFTGNTLAVANDVDTNFAAIAAAINTLGYIFNPIVDSAANNTTALLAALNALATTGGGLTGQPDGAGNGTGGRIWVAQRSYPVNAVLAGYLVPDQTIIEAAGYGGIAFSSANPFYHFVINGSGASGITGLVFFTANGGHTGSGVSLRGLSFSWASSTNSTDMAVSIGVWNARVIECTFKDTPCAVGVGVLPDGTGNSGSGLASIIERCTIQVGFGAGFPDYSTSIWQTGEQAQIIGPSEFSVQTPSTYTSLCAISIGGGQAGSEKQVLRGLHIFGYNYGIDWADVNNTGIKSGATLTSCENIKLDCSVICMNMSLYQPNTMGSGHAVAGIYCANVSAAKGGSSTDAHPVWVIDTAGNQNNYMQSVDLIGCLIFSNVVSGKGTAQPNQHGLRINGGGSIRVIGGKIGGLGTLGGGSDGTTNITISSSYTPPYNSPGSGGYPAVGLPPSTGSPVVSSTNGPDSVLILGVDLRPTYVNQGNASGPSQFALKVAGTQAGAITVRDCDMSGYGGGGPVSVTATFTGAGSLIITECLGYNDQGTDMNGGVVPLSPTSAMSASNPYFGPQDLQFHNGNGSGTVTLTLGGTSYVIAPGEFVSKYITLPSVTVSFAFSGGATSGNLDGYKWKGR